MLPYHHLCVNKEMKEDLGIWLKFLNNPVVYCRPFLDFTRILMADQLFRFTDVSGTIGYGGIYNKWFYGEWEDQLLALEPSIEFKELYGVAVSIFLWAHNYRNSRICLFCDNQAVVSMINNATSNCRRCLVLVHLIMLRSLELNVRIFAKFVSTKDNYFADSLSRGQLSRFWKLAHLHGRNFKASPEKIPQELFPIVRKIWKI